MQCQERGLGWDLGGALGWRQLQLVGSEVTNRCPSQPPALGCWSFVRVLISICQISLICNSGVHKGKWKKTQYKVGNCFLVAFDGLPAQATNEQFIFWCAAWHTIDATLKTKSCMAYCTFPLQGLPCHPSFPFVHRLRHVKTVICLGGNTSAHSGALKLSFVQGHWRSTKRLWKSFNTFFYQQPSDLREESCNNAAHSKFHKKLWFFWNL